MKPDKKVHQILRELAVGICLKPSISSDANYHHSTSCQLPPACIDTKIGQILISVDYMAEVVLIKILSEKKNHIFFWYLVVLKLKENCHCFFFLGPNFKCQHFQFAQNEYFYVHGFDVGIPSVKDILLEIVILVCCLSCDMHVCVFAANKV
ncbi:LOW QUALITY PROTEIN: ankyrin and armadillo repeat-containing protein [Phoenicopterus ruber ruber]